MDWQPIETAPKDGTRFKAKGFRIGTGRNFMDRHGVRYRLQRITWWGKTSHIPLYGWCHGTVENVDRWEPTHWSPMQGSGLGSGQ
jgi:hypothetical protein